MASSENTTTFTTRSVSNSTGSTTPPTTASDLVWIGIPIAVAIIIILVIVILTVWYFFCRHCGKYTFPRPGYENFSDPPLKKRGLRNLGNTCYFNSAIQCLASTPVLKSQVHQGEAVGKKEITKAYLNFIEPIGPESGSASSQLNPKPLLAAFRAKVSRFRGTQEHDSHELLRHFLDQLRQEERASWTNVNPNKQLTAVDKVFGGHSMTVYICENCKTPYHICEPFLDISVPICVGELTLAARQTQETQIESMSPYQKAIRSVTQRLTDGSAELPTEIMTITDCLQYFTRQEKLGHQYMCSSCVNDSSSISQDQDDDTKLTPATKQTLILNPPAVLVIHLKRFEMKKPRFVKRSNIIKFEELLDLAPYCSSWCLRNEDRAQNIWYSLYGVVVHSGSLTSGHYVAYVKERNGKGDLAKFLQKEYFDRDVTEDQLVEMMQILSRKGGPTRPRSGEASTGIWYCMNDLRVSKVTVDKVLGQEAFLLFYERVSPIEEHD